MESVATHALEVAAASVGMAIRMARLRKDLTDREVARHLGTNKVQISAVERGVKHSLSDVQIDALYAFLDLRDQTGRNKDFLRYWRTHATKSNWRHQP
jgi:transcriptional regulator with XRE-family HTH domain